MGLLRDRFRVLKAAVREALRVAVTLYLIYTGVYVAVAVVFAFTDGRPDPHATVVFVSGFVVLAGLVFGGFLLAALGIAALCLLGVPVGVSAPRPGKVARFPTRAKPPSTRGGVYDPDLDG